MADVVGAHDGFPGSGREVQRREVSGGDAGRRPLEQRARVGGLREGDHVAQRGCTGQQHRDAIEAEREAAVRRRSGCQRVEQEAEATALLVGGNAEEAEDRRLQRRVRDPDRAAAEFVAVVHRVVVQGAAARGSLSTKARSSGWGDVNGWCVKTHVAGRRVQLEQREVDHPGEGVRGESAPRLAAG